MATRYLTASFADEMTLFDSPAAAAGCWVASACAADDSTMEADSSASIFIGAL
jgi:hypothetical protein